MTVVVARRGRPTVEEAKSKLEQVLVAARELFCELGYRAVTMRDVAEKAQVSTRTLYNRYADKLSLFSACLDSGSSVFPHLPSPHTELRQALHEYAVQLVHALSKDTSLRLGMLVFREGPDFPEMVHAAEANQDRHLVQPLAHFFRETGLAGADAVDLAKLFMSMALSDWQGRVTFRRPLPDDREIDRHATRVVSTFLRGVQSAAIEAGNRPVPRAVGGRDVT